MRKTTRHSTPAFEQLLRDQARLARDQAPAELLPRLLDHREPVAMPMKLRRSRAEWVPQLLMAAVVAIAATASMIIKFSPCPEPRPSASTVLNASLNSIPRSARRLAEMGTKPLREPIGLLSRSGKSRPFGL
jgi:hypothetical protein